MSPWFVGAKGCSASCLRHLLDWRDHGSSERKPNGLLTKSPKRERLAGADKSGKETTDTILDGSSSRATRPNTSTKRVLPAHQSDPRVHTNQVCVRSQEDVRTFANGPAPELASSRMGRSTSGSSGEHVRGGTTRARSLRFGHEYCCCVPHSVTPKSCSVVGLKCAWRVGKTEDKGDGAATSSPSNDGRSSLVGKEEGPTSESHHLGAFPDALSMRVEHIASSVLTAHEKDAFVTVMACSSAHSWPQRPEYPHVRSPTANVGNKPDGLRQAKAAEPLLVSRVPAATLALSSCSRRKWEPQRSSHPCTPFGMDERATIA